MNVYDVYLGIPKSVSDQERQYAHRFLNLNDDHFCHIEGLLGLKMCLTNLRKVQEQGVAVYVDVIYKRCPYDTYEDVTSRFVKDGKVKDSISCNVPEYLWKFEMPKERSKEVER